ncbi:MAG: hypothetical protein BWY99_02336 [Synergistetes bacterium ADurb.BinA166]|nr:MAG: hypothetical protein BWY99_02336 [Synergistetes bacterium ADurb.BinA166]
MAVEAGVLVGLNERPIFWHLPPRAATDRLPDDGKLWSSIWENRENVLGFARSHLGGGVPSPSLEDLTTFRAIEQGLGRKMRWWIVSLTNTVEVFTGRDRTSYSSTTLPDDGEPGWVWKLREHSFVPDPEVSRRGE